MFYSSGAFAGISLGHETAAEEIELLCSLSFSNVVLQLIPPVISAECEKRYAPPDFSYSYALYFHR